MSVYFYILRLRSGKLYSGVAKDLQARYAKHQKGDARHRTREDPPVKLAYSEELESLSAARKREAQVKRWSRAKKEALLLRVRRPSGIMVV